MYEIDNDLSVTDLYTVGKGGSENLMWEVTKKVAIIRLQHFDLKPSEWMILVYWKPYQISSSSSL